MDVVVVWYDAGLRSAIDFSRQAWDLTPQFCGLIGYGNDKVRHM
jgi:hypothetical protein